MPTQQSVDIIAENHGSIWLMDSATDEGALWLTEHIDYAESQTWGGKLAVEHRYAGPIVAGARRDGLAVEIV